MSFRNFPRALAIVCLGSTLFAGQSFAQLPGAVTETNLPSFRASLKTEEVVGGTNAKPLQRVFLTSGTNKFTFMVPEDFRVDASMPNKIVLNSPDYSCFISVRFVDL